MSEPLVVTVTFRFPKMNLAGKLLTMEAKATSFAADPAWTTEELAIRCLEGMTPVSGDRESLGRQFQGRNQTRSKPLVSGRSLAAQGVGSGDHLLFVMTPDVRGEILSESQWRKRGAIGRFKEAVRRIRRGI